MDVLVLIFVFKSIGDRSGNSRSQRDKIYRTKKRNVEEEMNLVLLGWKT